MTGVVAAVVAAVQNRCAGVGSRSSWQEAHVGRGALCALLPHF